MPPRKHDAAATEAGDAADAAAACTVGSLCPDKTICTAPGDAAPTCAPCTTDTECSGIASGTLCIAGKCETASCHPTTPSSKSDCATAGSLCCSTASSAGTCIAPVSGKTLCCSNADCTGGFVCDLGTNTCACPAPTVGDYHVANTGSDTTGNGSSVCPFKTITKALDTAVASSAAAANTITLHHGGGIATFGTGCGTGTCDTTPIAIPSTITGSVVIKGDATLADVKVVGSASATSVFTVNAKAGFENMTLNPAKTGTSNAGAHGIVYLSTAPAAQFAVTNVLISGSNATAAVAGTGSAISIQGPASPTIGPNVQMMNGYHAILVQGVGANPTVSGTMTGTVTMNNFGGGCVNVFSTLTTGAPAITMTSGAGATSNFVTLTNCGGLGGIIVNTGVAGTGSSIDHVSITGSSAVGLLVTGTGSATVTGANIRNSGSDGIRCDSAALLGIKLRGSTTIGNTNNGLRVSGVCVADVGTATDPGNNTFNTSSQLNGDSGICTSSTGAGLVASSAKWKCTTSPPSGCVAASGGTSSPSIGMTVPGMFKCATGVDLTIASGTTVTTPAAQCCASVP